MLTTILLASVLASQSSVIHVLQDQGKGGVRLVTYELTTGTKLGESVRLAIEEPGAARRISLPPDRSIVIVQKSTSALLNPIRLTAVDLKSGGHILSDGVMNVALESDVTWTGNDLASWIRWDLPSGADRAVPAVHEQFRLKSGGWGIRGHVLTGAELKEVEAQSVGVESAARKAWLMKWRYHVGETSGLVEFSPGLYQMDGPSGDTGAVTDAGETFACFDANSSYDIVKASVNTFWAGRERKIFLDAAKMIAVHMRLQPPYILVSLAKSGDHVVDRMSMGYRYVSDMRASKVQVYSLLTGRRVFEAPGSAATIEASGG